MANFSPSLSVACSDITLPFLSVTTTTLSSVSLLALEYPKKSAMKASLDNSAVSFLYSNTSCMASFEVERYTPTPGTVAEKTPFLLVILSTKPGLTVFSGINILGLSPLNILLSCALIWLSGSGDVLDRTASAAPAFISFSVISPTIFMTLSLTSSSNSCCPL